MRVNEEQCKRYGRKWEGTPHPNDEKATKHQLVCEGLQLLAERKKWDLSSMYIWIDFSCIEQDDLERMWCGVASLRGYVAACDAVLAVTPQPPVENSWTVDMLEVYGERGWTRLEAMVAYSMGVLRNLETPDLWVAWKGETGSFELMTSH